MTGLIQFDQELFQLINGVWHNAFLDALLPYWRNKLFWIPLYLFLAGFVLIKYKLKGLFFILGVVLSIGLADTVSSKIVKKEIKRIRPCNDVAIRESVHLLVPCGPGYSFTSSHAANHFAIATFISLTLGQFFRKMRFPLFLWAASIAYAQVYVGLHYPFDILFGALLGSIIGYLTAKLYLSRPKISL